MPQLFIPFGRFICPSVVKDAFPRRAHRCGAALIACLTMMLAATPTAQAQIVRSTSGMPSRQLLNRFGLKRAWWNRATLDPNRDRIHHFTADEEVVYVQSRSGIVTAIDIESGKTLWSSLLGRFDSPSFPIASNEDTAMVIAGMELFAVNKFTGEVLWKVRTPAFPSSGAAADSQHAYVGFIDGSVYAFNLEQVRELYAEGRLPDWSYQTIAWRYRTGKEVSAPPITNGLVVNFASRDGSLYAVSAADRNLLFQFETDAPVSAPLAVSNSYLFMASEDFNFYCLNRTTGNVRWEFVSGLPIRKKPLAFDDEVYLLPVRGGVHCVATANGQRRWQYEGAEGFVAATSGRVYVTDRVGNVVILSRDGGAVQGSLPMRHFPVHVANDRTDRLFLATEDGLIVCLHEQGQEMPIYYRHPERRPILPELAPEPAPENPGNAAAE